MAKQSKIHMVMNKDRLLAEFRQLTDVLDDYGNFLKELELDGAWEEKAIQKMQAHHTFLLRTGASLRTIDLVSALVRQVVLRLNTEQFSFSGAATSQRSRPLNDASETAMADAEEIKQILSRLNAATRAAPLELQEKLRILLTGMHQYFIGLLDEDTQGVEDAMTRINLLTSNRITKNLLREIAAITRDIYRSLNQMSSELPMDSLTESSGGLTDAVLKLKSVIDRLEDYAEQNLDYLEQLNEKADSDQVVLEGVIESLQHSQESLMELKNSQPALADSLGRIQEKLSDAVGAEIMTLRFQMETYKTNYVELMANQSFHDLTGQTLRKIIVFIESLEGQLAELLSKYKPVMDMDVSPAKPEMDSAVDKEQSQTDVDKLFTDLGF